MFLSHRRSFQAAATTKMNCNVVLTQLLIEMSFLLCAAQVAHLAFLTAKRRSSPTPDDTLSALMI